MRVDFWSDVVCPWCYIGQNRFARGLAGFEHRDEVEVVYRSFELDPSIPPGPGTPILDVLAAKYGLTPGQAREAEERVAGLAAADGLDFTVDRAMGNTFDAHRLVHLGREEGREEEVLRRLFHAYFGEGRSVSETDTLVGLAAEAGLDPAGARQALADGSCGDAVRADEYQARTLGITGVPFCVVDMKYAVSGARATETYTAALQRAWDSAAADAG
jgi:predicted DsbA family dithiol-disulfide isomerase